MYLSRVNYLSVIVAAIAGFALGFVWFSEPIFGGIAMEALGLAEPDGTPSKYAVEFGKQFLVALAVAVIAAGLRLRTAVEAFQLSVLVGVALVAVVVSQHHWGGLPKVFTAIDAVFTYLSVLIFSLFACLWGKNG